MDILLTLPKLGFVNGWEQGKTVVKNIALATDPKVSAYVVTLSSNMAKVWYVS
jgi:hypothetical protein